MQNNHKSILSLDVGNRRIGVAVASFEARLARGLETIDREHTNAVQRIKQLIAENEVGTLVVGLPRDMNGNETEQTRLVKMFADELRAEIGIPLEFTDEAVTSLAATAELEESGRPYSKADVDRRAAVLILEDWLAGHAGTP